MTGSRNQATLFLCHTSCTHGLSDLIGKMVLRWTSARGVLAVRWKAINCCVVNLRAPLVTWWWAFADLPDGSQREQLQFESVNTRELPASGPTRSWGLVGGAAADWNAPGLAPPGRPTARSDAPGSPSPRGPTPRGPTPGGPPPGQHASGSQQRSWSARIRGSQPRLATLPFPPF